MPNVPPAPIDIVEGDLVSWRAVLDRADVEIASLRASLASKTREEEAVRIQLATVGFAAVGHEGALNTQAGERGHSHSLVDVVRLRRDWERLRDAVRGNDVAEVTRLAYGLSSSRGQ